MLPPILVLHLGVMENKFMFSSLWHPFNYFKKIQSCFLFHTSHHLHCSSYFFQFLRVILFSNQNRIRYSTVDWLVQHHFFPLILAVSWPVLHSSYLFALTNKISVKYYLWNGVPHLLYCGLIGCKFCWLYLKSDFLGRLKWPDNVLCILLLGFLIIQYVILML